jgi:hypothetical protein
MNTVQKEDISILARCFDEIIIHNKEMIIVKKLLFVALILLCVVPAVAAALTYTLTPWPYGVIAWVQMEPAHLQTIISSATQAVNDVFSFWDQPIPTPAEGWDQFKPMPRGAWGDSNYDPFTAGFLPVPSPTLSDIWEIPLPSWKGEKLLPLILIVFLDEDFMEEWTDRYTAGGLFNYWYLKEGIGTGIPLVSIRSLFQLVHRSYSITYCPSSYFFAGETLRHELSHWLFQLSCRKEGIDPETFSPLIIEGFAEYTSTTLSEDKYWQIVAAGWAEDHGLSDVPSFMCYSVGASLMEFLVERYGVDGVLNDLTNLSENWNQVAVNITPAWRTWASSIDLTEGDRAYYEATVERLWLCKSILGPVFPFKALGIVLRLYDRAGTIEDIDRFWQIISAPAPRPSDEVWQQMRPGEKTIAEVGNAYDDKDLQNLASINAFRLRELRELGEWDEYYDLLIASLREVIAHYGALPVTSETQ